MTISKIAKVELIYACLIGHKKINNKTMQILTVSELNRAVRNLLEFEMGEISVKGEVSNLSRPSSGHFYFTLKDEHAQLRCVYFRNRHHTAPCSLQNGLQMMAKGKLSIYEARGDYQLIVSELSEMGEGDLFRQFELLKKKLALSGLFDTAKKKPLPRFPRSIGIITSSSGAALRDILTTLKRRYPIATVIVYASEVQGKQAAPQLIKALKAANLDKRCDVLILARGGGSIEDLWAFNDEKLAYAIAESSIPVVSGVGHETDFTIADFVADFRAATPTAAAETITPSYTDLFNYLKDMETRLYNAILRLLQHKKLLLKHQMEKIIAPRWLIETQWQKLDYLTNHLHRNMQHSLQEKKHRLHFLLNRLKHQNPRILLAQTKIHLKLLEEEIKRHAMRQITIYRQHLQTLLATLHAVSPLATLDRGYAIVSHQQKILFSSSQVEIGDEVDIRLAQGTLCGKITGKGD
ncbi:exodeoxyribonuclease VII large subunit [Legionella londiniensis]|uniref:Exodeoxyribonuclease 7 large subunit n=2 Tax=Legionella londiniensis TaxID=45068 RepID=A0A0W0VR23_9GAMM|nr:exodeoxyribonuclease VII large subunit [Legionella londiniensis]STX93029.1 exodeoxyribonuclease VII large subunit [Legionella londiniensis]